jgi:ribosomal-protein-alanine N-acetyltransferase
VPNPEQTAATAAGAARRIERLGLEHLDEVLAIEKASYGNPWSRNSFIAELTQLPYSRLWGLREPGDPRLAAFAVVWVIAGEGHLANLATDPAHRRRGHARALLQTALDDARRREARFMLLEVRAGNGAAITLYREFGFRDYGRRPKYYEDGEDALLMRLDF